jgi:hypothetical protein
MEGEKEKEARLLVLVRSKETKPEGSFMPKDGPQARKEVGVAAEEEDEEAEEEDVKAGAAGAGAAGAGAAAAAAAAIGVAVVFPPPSLLVLVSSTPPPLPLKVAVPEVVMDSAEGGGLVPLVAVAAAEGSGGQGRRRSSFSSPRRLSKSASTPLSCLPAGRGEQEDVHKTLLLLVLLLLLFLLAPLPFSLGDAMSLCADGSGWWVGGGVSRRRGARV